MNYIFHEVIKSTYLTLALAVLFDLFIQGYSAYHNWVISAFVGVYAVYHIVFRRRHLHRN
ncbi:hypothetical protein [Psychromonas ossibalaenae]|uniref:hypothetical protein n=1 Tax=Psychromonas ossibalaenae TaxID=444922 RepID=UPI00039DE6ED|nr:hypothetical protein [Psychromonas ossibalaenae]